MNEEIVRFEKDDSVLVPTSRLVFQAVMFPEVKFTGLVSLGCL